MQHGAVAVVAGAPKGEICENTQATVNTCVNIARSQRGNSRDSCVVVLLQLYCCIVASAAAAAIFGQHASQRGNCAAVSAPGRRRPPYKQSVEQGWPPIVLFCWQNNTMRQLHPAQNGRRDPWQRGPGVEFVCASGVNYTRTGVAARPRLPDRDAASLPGCTVLDCIVLWRPHRGPTRCPKAATVAVYTVLCCTITARYDVRWGSLASPRWQCGVWVAAALLYLYILYLDYC